MTQTNPRSPGRLWLAMAAALVLPLHVSAASSGYFQMQIGLLVEYYEVDHDALPPLLRDYQKASDATGLLKQVQDMGKTGDSRLVESTYIVTRSGQRAKIESIREYIYPTEFDPAELPQKLIGPIDRDANIITPVNPTAYEMRPVGNTLEVDPVVSADGTFVELNVAPELVEFHGFKNWGEDESRTPMPLFYAMKTSTAVTVGFGGCELLGVFTPAGAHGKAGAGKRVLGFILPTRLAAATKADYEAFQKDPKKFMPEDTNDPSGTTEVDDPFAEGAGDIPESAPERPRQISIVTEFIEVDAALASRIARQLNTTADATAIRRRLDGVIAKGKARVLESSTLLTRSGQRTKAESIRELIYPTEYDPAEIPQEMHGPIDRDLDFKTSVGATAFEMRPTGITVEADPVLARDGSIIELNFAPETVRLAGGVHHGTGLSKAEHPLFETLKLSTSVAVADGTSMLLGIHSLESARAARAATEKERKAVRNRRVLVIVTAKVKTLK